jgi:hypothetical protein
MEILVFGIGVVLWAQKRRPAYVAAVPSSPVAHLPYTGS